MKDKGVNLTSIAHNFKDWATGEPMGIGETTYKVLILADYVEMPFEASRMIWEVGHRKGAAKGGLDAVINGLKSITRLGDSVSQE